MAINYETRTQAYIDVDSSFGTASVNLVDGNLSFNHTDWEFGGGPTAFSLSHVYAGANYNNNQFYTGLNTGNGYGWKTNFDQYLIGDTTGAIYIDASGRKHTFKNSNGTIYDDGGLGLKLTKVNSTSPCKIVTDLVGNTMHFSATGYLCRIDTIFGNSIFVRHNAFSRLISLFLYFNDTSSKFLGIIAFGLPKVIPFSFAILIPSACLCLIFSLSFWATKLKTCKTISAINFPNKFLPSTLVFNKGKSITKISTSKVFVNSDHSCRIIS